MLEGLKEKATLERKVVASERLAAVGRLTAGIAHEINNPFGGMLNAISNYRRKGRRTRGDGKDHRRCLSGGSHRSRIPFRRCWSRPDWPAMHSRLMTLRTSERWSCPMSSARVYRWTGETSLPESDRALDRSAPDTAQLLLNGVEGADERQGALPRGRFRDEIQLEVENDGPGLSPNQREHLFEPFAQSRTKAKGWDYG